MPKQDLTFADMQNWSIQKLNRTRNQLREQLSLEIFKRDAIKAEILFLQKEIRQFQINKYDSTN
jgi:hypothetical protein